MRRVAFVFVALIAGGAGLMLASTREASSVHQPAGGGTAAAVTGELKQWHKVTLTLDGPQASETAADPNPFMDYRMTVTFAHESGSPSYQVPGYFAGDGHAGSSSAAAGNKWRAHFSPDKTGRWTWRVAFVSGKGVAIDTAAGKPVAPADGQTGTIQIAASDKRAPDFRALGRLHYVGGHYLRFAGSGDYFLKVGADAPETLLAYADFDGTTALKPKVPLHTFGPHVADWKPNDPTWKDGKGKGLIGAVNYLASKGVNAMSFIPYNAGGDGDNVWPFVARDDKFHYDVSKLDQWQVFFDYAQQKGVFLHFKLQETENDDNITGHPTGPGGTLPASKGAVPTSLDGGDLGPERKLYLREIIARFGYELALNWNLGEENTQTADQQRAMAQFIRDTDPYHDHHIVIHTFPNMQETVYPPLLGDKSVLTGASLQNGHAETHERTVRWVTASAEAGRPWAVANDEQGPATIGVPPDPGYQGYAGKDASGKDVPYDLHSVRKYTLWGNLMAGGFGVEYYTGYLLADNDLVLENFRSRDKSWGYGQIALTFFRSQKIPFWEMKNADELVANPKHDNSRYCFAKPGALYLVYLPEGTGTGQTSSLDLSGATGAFSVSWFDPRNGGALKKGSVSSVKGGAAAALGTPPDNPGEDWLVLVRKS